jgi:hypothetical protein
MRDSLAVKCSMILKRPTHAYSRHHDLEQILQQNDTRAFRCIAFCASDRIACCMGNLASTFPCALLAILSGRQLYAYYNNRTTDRISMEFDAGKFYHIFQLWLSLVKNDTRCTWKPAFISARFSYARGDHSTQRTQVKFVLKMDWKDVWFTFQRSFLLKQIAKFRRRQQFPPYCNKCLANTWGAHPAGSVHNSRMFVLISTLP